MSDGLLERVADIIPAPPCPARHPRCTACTLPVLCPPGRTPLGVLAGHWISAHRERWLEMHPEYRA